MNPAASHPLEKSPDADYNAVPRAHEKQNAETDQASVEEIEETLHPTKSSYRAISTGRSGILLCSIIIANCFCSIFICLCLWGFSKIDDLTRWEKRSFNTLSLLLSACLSFGIGFLCDHVGLLARGTVLQCKPHSTEEVCACVSLVTALIISFALPLASTH